MKTVRRFYCVTCHLDYGMGAQEMAVHLRDVHGLEWSHGRKKTDHRTQGDGWRQENYHWNFPHPEFVRIDEALTVETPHVQARS